MDQYAGSPRLEIDSAYYNQLDIRSFALMLKDPSFCYKFYWLEAIVYLISEGVTETTFDGIIDEMICSAWYSVREFHIHLSGLGSGGDVFTEILRKNMQPVYDSAKRQGYEIWQR